VIRVGIVEDQAIVRLGLRKLLEFADEIEVVCEAGSGEEALGLLGEVAVDVLLLDVRMPGMSGIEVLEKLPEDGPHVIILTTFLDEEVLLDAVRLGARGYLLKDSSLEELLQAIGAVHRGESAIKPVTLSRILPGLHRISATPTPAPVEALTAREQEILRLLAAGLSNKEIARALENAEGTIKNHVSNILLKLAVRDRTQAVLKGIEHGLL
jgi:DNA-binding NarL/FixJ family response regulator